MTTLIPVGRTPFALFTTAEAAALALDRKALARLRGRRVIESVCRGVYAVGVTELSSEQRHRRLIHAGLLLYPDAVVSHASALSLQDVPIWPNLPARVDLTRPIGHEILTQAFRMRPAYGEVVRVGGLPARDVASSLLRFTIDAGPTAGTLACDNALNRGLVDRAQLEAAFAAVVGTPGSARCRTMLVLTDPRRESVGESRLGILAIAAGIRLVPQVTIVDEDGEFVARVDFLVEGTKVVVEFDGKIKYTEGGPDALFAEKRREDRLRRLGYTVIRVTWSDLQNPARLVALLRGAISAA
ncbi:endonuclease domain-containing protein [Knoellia locipacati]|uniref:DUF559 domain-containing protein n=1 Tax=Knoellia locipacati TaxID=882824 RepID=UPI00384FF534